jgi:hypothetical protein
MDDVLAPSLALTLGRVVVYELGNTDGCVDTNGFGKCSFTHDVSPVLKGLGFVRQGLEQRRDITSLRSGRILPKIKLPA